MTKKTIAFVKEKETKNTVKFNEQPAPGEPPVVGTLYVQKWIVDKATAVKVTLETV